LRGGKDQKSTPSSEFNCNSNHTRVKGWTQEKRERVNVSVNCKPAGRTTTTTLRVIWRGEREEVGLSFSSSAPPAPCYSSKRDRQ